MVILLLADVLFCHELADHVLLLQNVVHLLKSLKDLHLLNRIRLLSLLLLIDSIQNRVSLILALSLLLDGDTKSCLDARSVLMAIEVFLGREHLLEVAELQPLLYLDEVSLPHERLVETLESDIELLWLLVVHKDNLYDLRLIVMVVVFIGSMVMPCVLVPVLSHLLIKFLVGQPLHLLDVFKVQYDEIVLVISKVDYWILA